MNRLTTANFRDFLYELLVPEDPKINVGTGRVIDMADRFVLVSDTGNGTDIMQGLFERRIFRVQSRGRAENLDNAEQLASLILEKLNYLENIDYGDIRILSIRNTSKPRQMTYTDSDGRYMFVAEYQVTSSKD